jgi:hypothetical protein
MAARTTQAKEGALLELGNSYYLFSFDLFGNKHSTFLIKTNTRLDLSHKETQRVKMKEDFLYYFGVGVFTACYHIQIAEINILFKQKQLKFEMYFVPEEIHEEEDFEKVDDDRCCFQTQLTAEDFPLEVEKKHFSSFFKRCQTNDTNFKGLQIDDSIISDVKFTNSQEEVKTTNHSINAPTMSIKKKLQLSCTVFLWDVNYKNDDYSFQFVKSLSY